MEKVKSRWRKSYLEDTKEENGVFMINSENKDTSNNSKCDFTSSDENNVSRHNHNSVHTQNNHTNNHHNHHHHNNHANSNSNSANSNDHNHHHNKHHHHHHHRHSRPEFENITENIYLDSKNDKSRRKRENRMVCECTLSKENKANGMMGCAEDCLNRMLMIECSSRCNLGERCLNKRFQNKQYAKVEVFKTRKKGHGLRATEDLPPQTFIMEYVGEVVGAKEFKSRVKKYNKMKIKHHYFMALGSDEVIDATMKGNLTRFINHSCEPNCETQKWTISGELRIGFFTLKTVQQGEEITFDYQFQRYGKKAQKCYCEAPACRGYIGGNDSNKIDMNGDSPSKDESNLQPGFKIPKLTKSQRKEIEKKLDEEMIEEDIGKIERERTNLLSSSTSYAILATKPAQLNQNQQQSQYQHQQNQHQLQPPPPPPLSSFKLNPLAVKRRFDSPQSTNNIDLTPARKMSKEEHRQQFEMQIRFKDYYDSIEKLYGSAAVEQIKISHDDYYTKRNEPPSVEAIMTYPCPGTYYKTPSGEIWFATVTLDRQTQRPQSVMLCAVKPE